MNVEKKSAKTLRKLASDIEKSEVQKFLDDVKLKLLSVADELDPPPVVAPPNLEKEIKKQEQKKTEDKQELKDSKTEVKDKDNKK